AEDVIRDWSVTGVQTCALPISDADRGGRLAARPFGGRPVPVGEGRGVHPSLERRLVPPPGHHQPGGPPVGRLEEFEALEAVLVRSEEHTSELQSLTNLVCRLLL